MGYIMSAMASQAFRKKSIIGKVNRASECGGVGGSFHTCGSISTSQHRYNMVICFATYFLSISWKVCIIL